MSVHFDTNLESQFNSYSAKKFYISGMKTAYSLTKNVFLFVRKNISGEHMKNLILASALLALTSGLTQAATTGTLLLQGVVPQKVSIAVTSQAVASALDLSTSQSDLVVASVNEKSNSKTGYKVTITSANLSKLKRTDGADVLGYTMKYNGSALALTSAAGTTLSSSAGTSVNVNKSVAISYTGVAAESMVEGTYADTVTFTIAAN